MLFADLCGFTELSHRFDAEDVRATLERFFATTDDVIRRHGGAVDKHVGDAVMAVFGAPVSHGNDTERAVRAALAMHAAVAALETPDGQRHAIHIGIANGEVVAGRTGSAVHADNTVTGEAANLAALLDERAGPGETVLAGGVHAAASRVATLEPLGEVALKGFAAPQPLWRVDAAATAPAAPDLALAGRVAERAPLPAVIDAAIAGTGQLVLLRDEPGIGKSRLVAEALDIARSRSMLGVRAQRQRA